MMLRAQYIEQCLREAFFPTHLEVIDESFMHSVPKGAETHFKVVMVTSVFEGKAAVARHKLVYAALGEALRTGLHALTMTLRTDTEWAASPEVLMSPACAAASK